MLLYVDENVKRCSDISNAEAIENLIEFHLRYVKNSDNKIDKSKRYSVLIRTIIKNWKYKENIVIDRDFFIEKIMEVFGDLENFLLVKKWGKKKNITEIKNNGSSNDKIKIFKYELQKKRANFFFNKLVVDIKNFI